MPTTCLSIIEAEKELCQQEVTALKVRIDGLEGRLDGIQQAEQNCSLLRVETEKLNTLLNVAHAVIKQIFLRVVKNFMVNDWENVFKFFKFW